jgi:exopolyphosphatase / guanosine-5'-triphosphate,3'-diphosphate pyrophosphatase
MAKGDVQTSEGPLRPLELDPERAKRVDRPPYAIVDIGSNSIRLLVYDQLGRAPMPRFNEKSLARLAEGVAESGAIAPNHFRRAVEAVRRFRAIADAMGVSRIDAVATEAMRRASNGAKLAEAIEAESGLKVRILSGGQEAGFATLGVISGFFRPVGSVGDMGGGSLEVAEAIDDHVGDRWVSLPLGALPVEVMMSEGLSAAKRQIDEILQRSLPKALARPVFHPVGGGWRALAKAHIEAVAAPVKVVHGYTLSAGEARDFARAVSRLTAAKLAATLGVTERRARTLPAAALTLDRVLKHLKPERVVFSALGLREGFLYSQLSREDNISIR